MTEYNYKISLRPIDDYYFGGERTFGGWNDKEQRNYFAYSNKYPQQTSIMGLVRYLLLEAKGLLPLDLNNRKEADSLIGENSFDPGTIAQSQDFGSIKKISPLYIGKEDALFRFAHPLGLNTLDFLEDRKTLVNEQIMNTIPSVKEFDPKEYYPDLFVPDRHVPKEFLDEKKGKNIEDKQCVFSETVFKGQHQIGIQKGADKEGFFKQEFFRLKSDFEFVFFVNIKELPKDTILKNSIVFFGGEQRQFRVNIASTGENEVPKFSHKKEGLKITLLSDALVNEEILSHCRFALVDVQEFRTGKFYANGYQFKGKSNKINLLKRGGILFAKDETSKTKVCDFLDHPPNYIQLGFNHYFIEE